MSELSEVLDCTVESRLHLDDSAIEIRDEYGLIQKVGYEYNSITKKEISDLNPDHVCVYRRELRRQDKRDRERLTILKTHFEQCVRYFMEMPLGHIEVQLYNDKYGPKPNIKKYPTIDEKIKGLEILYNSGSSDFAKAFRFQKEIMQLESIRFNAYVTYAYQNVRGAERTFADIESTRSRILRRISILYPEKYEQDWKRFLSDGYSKERIDRDRIRKERLEIIDCIISEIPGIEFKNSNNFINARFWSEYFAYIKETITIFRMNEWKAAGIAEILYQIDEMKGFDFENEVAKILRLLGHTVEVTQQSGDFGVDLITTINDKKTAIQVKRSKALVSVQAPIEALAGMQFYDCDRGVVLTNSQFTKPAVIFSDKTGIELWGRDKLIEMLKLTRSNQTPTIT